jgi:hypothetical protein
MPEPNLTRAMALTEIIADTIREVKEAPSGVLYSALMGHMSLDQYEQTIRLLVSRNLIKKAGHLLTWIGPAAESINQKETTK